MSTRSETLACPVFTVDYATLRGTPSDMLPSAKVAERFGMDQDSLEESALDLGIRTLGQYCRMAYWTPEQVQRYEDALTCEYEGTEGQS